MVYYSNLLLLNGAFLSQQCENIDALAKIEHPLNDRSRRFARDEMSGD